MKKEKKVRRRLSSRTWLWLLAGFGTTGALIYWEQIALLYILSTAVLTILMIVVTFSNLKNAETGPGGAEENYKIDK